MNDPHKSRVLVDVDGTLTIGKGNFPHEFAPLQVGVRAFLGALKDRGLEVVIFSARSPVDAVKQFLKREGLMRYVDGVTRTKKPARVIIDDRALTFRGDFGDTLAELDRFKPHWEKENKFSCVMAYLPSELADKIKAVAATISEEDLHEDGREEEPHVTVKWGIHGDDPSGVRRALEGRKPISIKLGPLSLFESDKQDVLKADVESPELHEWNAAVNREAPHTDTFPDYHPHVTVAYLKPGIGKKYIGDHGISGTTATISSVVFSDTKNNRTEIPV
jgi:2'-5' RNA ligase